MPKPASTGNRMLTEFFKPKTSEPPTKRARIESGEKPPSPSPTPSPATLVASSAEQSDAFKAPISDPNASFASMRSTSSKRIITSSGQQLVMGSDSDTDEDLEDLDTLLNRSKSKPKPAGTDLFGDFRSSNVIPKKQEQKKYTFNLSRLVEEQRQQTAMEVRIGEAQANLHEASKEAAAASASPNKDTIQAVLTENTNTEDGGRARRVMEALERTDAFERHDVWHFFEEQPLKLPRNPFPRISHSNAMLKATLNDPERRRQSFASGFLQRIAGTIPLPDELLSWLMLEVCRESKDVLLSAYMETLFQAADSTSSCLSSESLLHCFRTLGARSEALDARSPIRHRPVAANGRSSSSSSNIVPFITILRKLSPALPLDSKDTVAHFLIRASFDQGVLSDAQLRSSIEACFRTLLDAYTPGDQFNDAVSRISKAVFNSIQSPTLRLQLITSLPATSTSTHYFRRSLALAFALDRERHLDASLINPALTGRMLLLFEKGSALRIKSDTDYVTIRARLSMLDMALDAGFSDFEFLDNEDKQAEKQFNDSIDLLSESVREMSARIIDAGAAHMLKTEAKVVAERVVQRLEFSVRTREKPPKDWFGEQDKQEKKEFMKGWMGVKKEEGDAEDDKSALTNQVNIDTVSSKQLTDAIVEHEASVPSTTRQSNASGLLPSKKDEGEKPAISSAESPQKKVVIQGSSSPMAKKGQNPMVLMRW